MAIEDMDREDFDEYLNKHGKSGGIILLTLRSFLETLEESGTQNTEQLDYSSGEAMKHSIERLLRDAITTYEVTAEAVREGLI